MQVRWIKGDLDAQSAPWRAGLRLMAVFCILAIAIAGVGVASIGFRTVQVRRRDIGIALALGASYSAVARQFLGRAALITAAASAAALVIACVVINRYSSAFTTDARISYSSVIVEAVATTTVFILLGFVGPVRSISTIQPVEILKEVA
jgi:ABC-type antimicrobial peptide transport system permease subunit